MSKSILEIDVIVAEIGSTTTVVNAFNNINGEDPEFLGQGQSPTTVFEGGDVRNGFIARGGRMLNEETSGNYFLIFHP